MGVYRLQIGKIDLDRFTRLQEDVDDVVREYRRAGEPCKVYDATWEMTYEGVETDSEDSEHWRINLHCYLIGPSRHYTWVGASMEETLRKCEDDVRKWIVEAREELNQRILGAKDGGEEERRAGKDGGREVG